MTPDIKKRESLKSIHKFIYFFGFNARVFYRNITGIGWYLRDFFKLKRLLKRNKHFSIKSFYAVLTDKSDNAGTLSGHYFHQDLLVAQKIFQQNPIRHVDIGSRTDGFVAHVASFRPIDVIDIRPLKSNSVNINFLQADFMHELPQQFVESTDSLSCLHALEHFGLGRYGDPIDDDGHVKGFNNLKKMVKPGGKLYFSTPIGKEQRIVFNAHRVFSIKYLMELFTEELTIEDFYFVDDNGNLNHPQMPLTANDIETSFNCHYGCGIFILNKR